MKRFCDIMKNQKEHNSELLQRHTEVLYSLECQCVHNSILQAYQCFCMSYSTRVADGVALPVWRGVPASSLLMLYKTSEAFMSSVNTLWSFL